MEVLESAAKTHSPQSGNGKIIPYGATIGTLSNATDCEICRIGPCDVTSKEELNKLAEQIKEKEQGLDLLSELPSTCLWHHS